MLRWSFNKNDLQDWRPNAVSRLSYLFYEFKPLTLISGFSRPQPIHNVIINYPAFVAV